jgi:uncharacterized protein YjcR
MGYTSSPSKPTGTGNQEMDELMKLVTRFMALTAEKKELEAKLETTDAELASVATQIKHHPQADKMKDMLAGIGVKPKGNNRR